MLILLLTWKQSFFTFTLPPYPEPTFNSPTLLQRYKCLPSLARALKLSSGAKQKMSDVPDCVKPSLFNGHAPGGSCFNSHWSIMVSFFTPLLCHCKPLDSPRRYANTLLCSANRTAGTWRQHHTAN